MAITPSFWNEVTFAFELTVNVPADALPPPSHVSDSLLVKSPPFVTLLRASGLSWVRAESMPKAVPLKLVTALRSCVPSLPRTKPPMTVGGYWMVPPPLTRRELWPRSPNLRSMPPAPVAVYEADAPFVRMSVPPLTVVAPL
jgi:hypothetical protein